MTRCVMGSKLTIKETERSHPLHSDVFIVNVKHTLHLNLVFLLWTLDSYSLVEKIWQN